jgi:hypothetical protein
MRKCIKEISNYSRYKSNLYKYLRRNFVNDITANNLDDLKI